jgi:hypothetical protein
MVSAGSIRISWSRPSTLAPILILRTKGDDGEWRSVNMGWYGPMMRPPWSRGGGRHHDRSGGRRGRQRAGDINLWWRGWRPSDPCPSCRARRRRRCAAFGQRLEPGALYGSDMYEHVAAPVIRLDEAVAALGVEEFDGTCHGHRETPFPRGCSAADPHGTAARPDIRERGKQRPYGLPHSAGPHRRRNVKASSYENMLI